MKSVTYEEFKGFGPCWVETPEGRRKLERIGRRKERWTAVDILDLPDSEVSAEDKLWAALRPELIEEATLHEFACRCAEEALKLVENPDPGSVAAIEAKRKWLKGEITDQELDAASAAAIDASAAAIDARASAIDARAAARAAWDAARAAWDARDAWDAARKKQVRMLWELIAD